MLRAEEELEQVPSLQPVSIDAVSAQRAGMKAPAKKPAPAFGQPSAISQVGGLGGLGLPTLGAKAPSQGPNGLLQRNAERLGGVPIPGQPATPELPPTDFTKPAKVAPVVNPMTPLGPVPAAPGAGPIQSGAPGAFPQTDPNNPLTTQTIQRTPAQDRFAIAQQRFNTFVESTDPQYKAALRDANRYGAATGRLGSGDLRTDFGNLAGQRDLQLRTQGNTFLQNALEGTIDDQFRDVGVAQQQQGFQNQQQQQAFENELRRLGFSEDMINSAFGRALQQYNAGSLGGTGSGTGIQVGQNTFNQGSDALAALNALIRGRPATGGAPMTTPPINPQTTRYPWQAPQIPVGAG